MEVQKITVTSEAPELQEALNEAERLGEEGGLSKKEILHLRLLTEELIGMLRGITGEVSAEYWIEREGKAYSLHLASDVPLNRQMREQLIAASSSGTNAAVKGFMGKIREMIAAALLPADSRPTYFSALSMGFGAAASGDPYAQEASAEAFRWSMQQYRSAAREGKGDEWDELEKSIVASIADEVIVSVENSHVEITIDKSF